MRRLRPLRDLIEAASESRLRLEEQARTSSIGIGNHVIQSKATAPMPQVGHLVAARHENALGIFSVT